MKRQDRCDYLTIIFDIAQISPLLYKIIFFCKHVLVSLHKFGYGKISVSTSDNKDVNPDTRDGKFEDEYFNMQLVSTIDDIVEFRDACAFSTILNGNISAPI